MEDRILLKDKKRIIIKIGSSSITHEDTGHISLSKMERFVRQIADLKNRGKEVIVVSSGAIAVGISALNLTQKPTDLDKVQAVASVGQASLIMLYQKLFREYNQTVGQVLITKDVLDHQKRKDNAVKTFNALMAYDAVTIVNENDTLSTEEIEFGDNDRLSAIVASLVQGDLLILLSDIDGLYNKNPKVHDDAKLIEKVAVINEDIRKMAGDSHSKVGTGGMITKLLAGEIATSAGVDMVIANSKEPQIIERITDGENIGTLFVGNR